MIYSRLRCCKRKIGDAEGDRVSCSKSQLQKWRRREGKEKGNGERKKGKERRDDDGGPDEDDSEVDSGDGVLLVATGMETQPHQEEENSRGRRKNGYVNALF